MVRNPMLALAGVAALRQLSPDVRTALRAVLVELANDARARAEESWRRHTAPMAPVRRWQRFMPATSRVCRGDLRSPLRDDIPRRI